MAHRPDSLVIRSRVEFRNDVQKDMFISILENVGTIRVAARLAGLAVDTIYRWRKEDANFATRWDEAVIFSKDVLKSATYLKVLTAMASSKSIGMGEARLAELLLKGAFPDEFKDRVEFETNLTIDWSLVADDVLVQFNSGLLTLQDVYEITIRSEKPKEPQSSEDRRTEGSSET